MNFTTVKPKGSLSMKNERKYYSPSEIKEILAKEKNAYFIGIGGVSMSSLAIIANSSGIKTAGSDRTLSEVTESLQQKGIDVQEGHEAKNIKNYSVVVYNAAIHADNPEYYYAATHNYFMIYRSDFLGYVISEYGNSIGVAGTHGKSTATAMIYSILNTAGLDPTVMNGAVIPKIDSQYHIGNGDRIVFEACEYKDSFLSFFPTVAVVLNAEYDHADYFENFDVYIQSFKKYLSHSEGGAACVNFDSPGAKKAAEDYKGELYSYGIDCPDVRITAKNIVFSNGHPEFDIYFDNKFYSHVKLSVFGMHNVYNTLAGAAVAIACGITDGDVFARGASSFTGIKRRFEYRTSVNGAEIYDDYAHHPTEITATLSAARNICTGRLRVVFQSHTYSRTKALFDDFVSSLSNCDEAIIADIYPARETDTLGMSAQLLSEKIPGGKYVGGFDKIAEYIKKTAAPNDTVIVMGAGDVNRVIDLLPSAE